jgi:NitT/TauT family transport system substrate-binding protein
MGKFIIQALRRAQQEIDIEPEPYKHFYARELPADIAQLVDVRRFGPGELYERTQRWLQTWDLFDASLAVQSGFEEAVLV